MPVLVKVAYVARTMSRVNMYASTWICTKVGPDPTAAVDAGEDETDAGVVEALEL